MRAGKKGSAKEGRANKGRANKGRANKGRANKGRRGRTLRLWDCWDASQPLDARRGR